VLASSAYDRGAWLAKVTKNDSSLVASQAWYQTGNAYQSHWSSAVVHEGFYYWIPSPSSGDAKLACLDAAQGTNRWTQAKVGSGNIGFGSVIKAANALVVLTESGELVLVQPSPTSYLELTKFKVLNKYCWNSGALSNGRLYVRSTSVNPQIVALDVAAPPLPLPSIELAVERVLEGDRIILTVRALDGTSLQAEHAERFEVRSASEISVPLGQWSVLTQALMASNGVLITEVPATDTQSRFLCVSEKSTGN
jgi:hypothetical protein